MKNVLVLLSLCWPLLAFAQPTEGIIYYTESVKLDIELPEGQEHLRDMIPSSSDQTKALYFTKDKSMYKDLTTEDDTKEINQESGDAQMQIKIVAGSADNRLLKNFVDKKMIDQRDFLGKKFLINGDIPEMKWKVTGEQKKILGYNCLKAVLQQEDEAVFAWFTPQIPLANGPEAYGELPGIILALSLDDGRRTITATKVELGPIDPSVLEKPTKGKKVTRASFQKIQEEKLKEMGAENGRTVIRMEIEDRG